MKREERETEREEDVCLGVDGGERWRSGRAREAKGQEIRGKGVKGNKWEVSAGVKRGELHRV